MALSSPIFLSGFLPLSLLLFLFCGRRKGLRLAAALLLAGGFFLLSGQRNAVSIAALLLLWLGAALLPRLGRAGRRAYLGYCLAALLLGRLPFAAELRPVGVTYTALQGVMLAALFEKEGLPQSSLSDRLMPMTFFPTMSSGPLLRPDRYAGRWEPAKLDWAETAAGLRRLTVGLAKKLLIAERLRPLAMAGYSGLGAGDSLLTALFAMLYVYYDFSGYTDMALGLGRMLGVALSENFDRPFSADSLRNFWRRWHITLSAFLRDFIYIPLGGSRRGTVRTAVALLLTFLASGLLHGATLPFLLFGLWHACWVMLEHFRLVRPGQWRPAARRLYVWAVMGFSFVIFLSPDGRGLLQALRGFACAGPFFSGETLAALDPVTVGAAALALALPWASRRLSAIRISGALRDGLLILLLAVCYVAAVGRGFTPFLYAGF